MSPAPAPTEPGDVSAEPPRPDPTVLPPPTVGEVMRSLVFTVWLYGSLVAFTLGTAPLLLGSRPWVWKAAHAWVRVVEWGLRVIVGCRVEVRGREHLPAGPVFIAGKHLSMLDTLTPMAELRDPAFVLKRELMRLPFWGWYAAKLDMLPIDRGGGAATLRSLVRGARERLGDGRQILIFPEGTRRPVSAPPAYKPGVAGLYRELGVPVTPMATNSGLCWPAHGFIRRPGVAVYAFLPPIPAGMKRASFMAVLEDTLEAASDALIAEELARRASVAGRS